MDIGEDYRPSYALPTYLRALPYDIHTHPWYMLMGQMWQQFFMFSWHKCDSCGVYKVSWTEMAQTTNQNISLRMKDLKEYKKILNIDRYERCIGLDNDRKLFYPDFLDIHRAGNLILSCAEDAEIYMQLIRHGLPEAYLHSRYNILDDLSDQEYERNAKLLDMQVRKKVSLQRKEYNHWVDFQVLDLEKAKNKDYIPLEERRNMWNMVCIIYYEPGLTLSSKYKTHRLNGWGVFAWWITVYYDMWDTLLEWVSCNKYAEVKYELIHIINAHLYLPESGMPEGKRPSPMLPKDHVDRLLNS